MTSLRELQKQFVRVLFEEVPESEVSWVRSTEEGLQLRGPRRAEAAARLAIYRNNLQEGFIGALALEFPVIQRLVGDDYFRQLARELLSAHPSRTGDLHAIGTPFSEYLRTRFADTEYAYFADVAALEWAYQQSAIAPEAAVFDVQALARVPPESYGALRFNLHPACFLIRSAYPILRIWQVNQAEEGDPDIVDLSAGPDYVVTRRLDVRVELRRVRPVEYVLLQCFSAGESLSEALGAVEQLDPTFDPGRALRQFIALGLVTNFHTENLPAHQGVLP